ncbi:MAG: zinc ABC transporter substrate-binding protein [Alcaligenaceae bacterium]|nr:MAG: zinc ABC transporter substrate-binding protein [Alcaligenaceae bacterium]
MKLFKVCRVIGLASVAVLCMLTTVGAQAQLSVFSTVPEWGALAEELGGDKVKVYVATNALQDPHKVQARPSLLARARTAQLLLSTGAELEIGWLPLLQREAGNSNILPGKPGMFEASQYVQLLGIPTSVDRSMGDVHAAGNPHIQTDPRNFLPIARALTERLAILDSSNNAFYQDRLRSFLFKWQANIDRWESNAQPLRGRKVWVQHDAYLYLNDWLGLVQVGTLEPTPGVDPSVAQLSTVLQRQNQLQGRMIITSAYAGDAASKWFSERATVPLVVLPFTVGGNKKATTLEAFFEDTLVRLLKADNKS